MRTGAMFAMFKFRGLPYARWAVPSLAIRPGKKRRAALAILLCSVAGLAVASTPAHAASQDSIADMAIQPDGKIVAAGLATSNSFGLARYLTDGTLDPTFSGDGKLMENFGSEAEATSVALQTDGKIVVAGTVGIGSSDFAVARYGSDGTADPSFSGDGFAVILASTNPELASVAVQPNGAILVADGVTEIIRLSSDGALDASFSEDGTLTLPGGYRGVGGLALQADGKIVLVGTDFSERIFVTRLDSDGDLDATFSDDGKVTTAPAAFNSGKAVAIQSDGKIVVAGSSGDAYTDDYTAIRYQTDGSLDPSFSGDGIATADVGGFDIANSIAIQSDGAILVGGEEFGFFAVARFLPSGSLDSSFAGDGVLTDHPDYDGRSVAVQSDGTILVGGDNACCASSSDFALSRYTSAGGKDVSFGTGGDVTTDFSGSETGGGESTPPPAGGGSVPPPSSLTAPVSQVSPGTAFLAGVAQVKGGKALIRTRCVGDTACRGVAKLIARVTTKRAVKRRGNRRLARRARNVVIGKSRFNIAAGKAGVLRIRLTGAGKKLLRRSGRRGLRARLVGRGLKNRTVKLKPPNRKKRRARPRHPPRGSAQVGAPGRG